MMRVLVVGAGIAGLTLAGLLRRQGLEPMVVECRPDNAGAGYGLALWPHGSRVLHALDAHDAFVARSEPMRRYTARDGDGRVLMSSPMPPGIGRYGHLGIIPRSDLLEILADAGKVEPRYGVSVTSLEDVGEHVAVRLTDATSERFDLVVGADGIGSHVRRMLHGDVPGFDSGWACYAWWADSALAEPGETTEQWAAGAFLGTYPCRDRLCVIAGGPREVLDDPDGRIWRELRGLAAARGTEALLDGVADDDLFVWRMADIRSPGWVSGRVALVGDAAAAFLPTAGIGASMALESAAALADELSRTDTAHVGQALELYERRRRSRVEAAQTQSRRLSRLMFIRSGRMSAARDRLVRHATMEQMVAPLIKMLRTPV